jgi:hypothetical protein
MLYTDGELQTMDEQAVIKEIKEIVPRRRQKIGFK